RGARFAEEAAARFGVVQDVERERLDRDAAVDERIVRFVDAAHAACADEAHDAILADLLHEAGCGVREIICDSTEPRRELVGGPFRLKAAPPSARVPPRGRA